MMSRFVRLENLRGKRSPLILLLLVVLWTVAIASSIAIALEPPAIETVDPVPQQLQLGQQLYRESCGTCHIAISPAVLPTQTWQQLLQDPSHYGIEIQLPIDPGRLLVWNYLRTYSRPQSADDPVPYRLRESGYLKALHPRVELPEAIGLDSCLQCHPGATDYNFRSLTPEWENAE